MSLSIFEFDSTPVRIAGTAEAPLFVAADVCRILGIQNPAQAADALEEDERTLCNTYGASNGLPVNCVTESGLYSLIFRSRKPQAKVFRRWVTGTVLPAIRQTGRYEVEAVPADLEPGLQAYLVVVRELVKLGARADLAAGAVGRVWGKLVSDAGCQTGLAWEELERKFVVLEECLAGEYVDAERRAAEWAEIFSWEGGAGDLSRVLAAYERKRPREGVVRVRTNTARLWRLQFSKKLNLTTN